MLDRLGASLKDALKKLAGKTVVDRAPSRNWSGTSSGPSSRPT